MELFTMLAIAAVMAIVSVVLRPKPKKQKPPAVTELEAPTAEAGKPMSKVWGTLTLKSPNALWFGDKDTKQYEVES